MSELTVETTYLDQNNAELWLQTPGFTDLSLLGINVDDLGNAFRISARGSSGGGNDLSWGAAEPNEIAVQRWMTDGAFAYTQGYENRTISFAVKISAESSVELAYGEAALFLRSGKSTLLKWVPMQGTPDAVPSIFEVWTWYVTPVFDQDDEMRLSRLFTITMTAKPWVRSETLTSVDTVVTSSAPTITSIDPCTSVTGWVGTPSTATSSGGSVREITTPSVSQFRRQVPLSLTRTGSVSGLTSAMYLMLDVTLSGGTGSTWTASIDNQPLVKSAQIGSVSYFQIPTGVTSFTTLRIDASYTVEPFKTPTLSLLVNDVSRSNAIGGVSSTKQLIRSLDVGGSRPTSGSIKIASPSTKLGTTVVYTSPENGTGLVPALRRYRTGGGTVTPDSTCVSGSRETFIAAGSAAALVTYTIPVGLLPEGTYAVVGRFLFGGAATATVLVHANVGTYPDTTISGSVTSVGGATWGVIGAMTLPPQSVPGESQLSLTLQVSGTSDDGGTHTLDEIYLFDITPGRGALTIVTDGVPSFTRLWIDSPDADPVRNRPAVYLGNQDDRSDAASPVPGLLAPVVMSFGDHDLDPQGMMLFTVTDKIDNAVVTGSFYQRWGSNAGS